MIVDKYYFQRDLSYKYFKDLAREAAFEKVLPDKAFNIA